MASTADHDMGQNSTNSKESMHKPKKAEENLEHTIQNLESGQVFVYYILMQKFHQ